MLKYLQKLLGGIGRFTYQRFYLTIFLVLIMTSISAYGLTQLQVESDFSQFDPQQVEIVQINNRIDHLFASFESFLVVVSLDDSVESDLVDIRDPQVMRFLVELNELLSKEQKIQEIRSAGLVFENGVPDTLTEVKERLEQIPNSDGFFNSRYSLTPVFISADVSGDSQKIQEITDRVRELVESAPKPGGVRVSVTGEPPLFAKIFDLLISDALFTITVATIVIFFMLFLIQRSAITSITIIIPVLFGVFWTLGMLGLFGVPITIATAAIGTMLLGLGVEYAIFLNSRYEEEKNGGVQEGIIAALSTTGASTVSSGITTMIGFFALTLSQFPMLADLGFSLGTGIGLIMAAVMIVGPITIITREWFTGQNKEEKTEEENRKEKGDTKEEKNSATKYFEYYGGFVSRRPWLVIIISIIATIAVFQGSNLIENQTIDFDTILPEDLPELRAFNLLEEEFEDTTTITILIELETEYERSNEPTDIRDPRIITYTDLLGEKARYISYYEDVESIAEIERNIGEGRIPQTLREQKEILVAIDTRDLISPDNAAMRMRIIFSDAVMSTENREKTILQVYELIETTARPPGISVHAAGGMVAEYELEQFVGPDSAFTALIAFTIIIIFLLLLSRSIKYTILPLITVVVAIMWILGLVGIFQIGWNSVVSSVISMTIGIGIDFGIQLSNRFRQELQTQNKRTAMKKTLTAVLYPMIITVISALIGFQAMAFGQVQMMGDLGRTMSISMVASMIVAITLVAGLMLVFEREKKEKKVNKKEKEKEKRILHKEENTEQKTMNKERTKKENRPHKSLKDTKRRKS